MSAADYLVRMAVDGTGSMKVTDCSFTNSDTEYNLIKEFLLEIETYPDIDNNWDPGRMDWWRYNYPC